jgi:hypothetical protein
MAITFPDYYDFIVTYQNNSNPKIKWRNTYTFYSATTPVLGAGIVAALATYTVGLIHSDASAVLFDVYNWARGRQPYPLGSPIISYPAADAGTADTYWSHLVTPYVPAAGLICLRVDKPCDTAGKPGRNFLRGLLGEGDTDAVSGGPPLLTTTVANLQANLGSVIAAAGLAVYFNAGTGGQHLAQIRFGGKPAAVQGVSEINGFSVIEATANKLSRKNKK